MAAEFYSAHHIDRHLKHLFQQGFHGNARRIRIAAACNQNAPGVHNLLHGEAFHQIDKAEVPIDVLHKFRKLGKLPGQWVLIKKFALQVHSLLPVISVKASDSRNSRFTITPDTFGKAAGTARVPERVFHR